MDKPTPIILKVATPEFKKVIVETSDGNRYFSDFSSFSQVYCFPSDEHGWSQVSIDNYGLGLTWSSRFEVHADQVIALAYKIERLPQPKTA